MSRLGLWTDAVYREEDGRVFTDESCFQFLRFASAVGDHFDELVLFGREAPDGVPTEFELPAERARLAPLPHYSSLRDVPGVLRALPRIAGAAWRGLGRVDLMWVIGPYPFSGIFVLLGLLRRKRVVLGVRQDTMEYYRQRLPHRTMKPLLGPLWLLEGSYRLMARVLPVTAVGEAIARRYGAPREGVLGYVTALTRASDVAEAEPERDWAGCLRLLSVGRIEPEKAPLLMVEALAELERRRPGRYSLTWAGTGRLADAVRARAEELGISALVEMPGYVSYEPDLRRLYGQVHMLVHFTLTEGVPQVVLQAMAAGTPIVASDVGGVRAALDGGAAGLIVPPGDSPALVRAIEETAGDAPARERRVQRGLELARGQTLEGESARVARFLAG